MISKQAVEEQLKKIGCNFRFWGRSEVNELGRILMDDEIIKECVNGEYGNGFAMLLATNHRLLLVDKKPLLYLTVEDYRYEMITEFNFNHRMLNAAINIHTTNKTMSFTSWNQHRLRRLLEYTQSRVLEMRQHQQMASQFSAAAASQFAQMYAAQMQQQSAVAQPQQHQSLPADQLPQIEARSTAEPALPPATAINTLPPAPTKPSTMSSRWANSRAALGTYTRSKLPSFHRPSPRPEQGTQGSASYGPSGGIGRFGIGYDFEA